MFGVRFIFLLFMITIVNCHILRYPSESNNVVFHSQFDYSATSSSIVESSNEISSGFTINGKLILFKIGTLKNYLIARFRDVTFSIEHNNDTIENPRRNQFTETLEKPFMIRYDSQARVIGVYVEKDDVKWSVDIKKGVSTLFQIDPKQIDLKNTKPYAFYSDEYCLMDECQAFCTIYPVNNSNFFMKKIMKYSYNVNHLSISSERNYAIEVHSTGYSVQSVKTIGEAKLFPFNGLSNAQKVILKQTLFKEKINLIPDESIMTFLTLFMHNDGLYHSIMSEFIYSDYPMTGSENSSVEKTLDIIKNINRENDINDDENFYFLLEQMKYLTLRDLEMCFYTLQNDASEYGFLMFINILPYVGTDDSLMYIYSLITKKNITDAQAVSVLQRIAHYRRPISKKTLIQVSSLHRFENLSHTLKKSSILASASLISKFNDIDDPEIEGLIREYIEGFVTSKDQLKFTYLCALKNTESKIAMEALEGIITDSHVSPHTKSFAMWSADHRLLKDSQRLNAVHWPIVEDTNEDLEVRLTSLIMLMAIPENLSKLYHIVAEEPELYAVYYSQLKSVINTSIPYKKKIVLEAQRILSTFPKLDINFENRVYSSDYFLEKYDIGGSIATYILGNLTENGFVTIFIKFWDKLPYSVSSSDSFYFHITSKNAPKENSMLSNILFGNTFVDFVWLKNDKVIQVEQQPFESHFDSMMVLLSKKAIEKKFMDIMLRESKDIMFPTDLGLPIVYFAQSPEIRYLDLKTKLIDQTFYNEWQFKQTNHHMFGLKAYNPFNNQWYGTRRNHILNINLPIDFTINYTSILVNNPHHDFGIQSFVYNEVFMNNQVLKRTNTKHNQHIIWKKIDNFTGIDCEIGFYECENKLSMTQLKNSIIEGHKMDWGNNFMVAPVAMREFWSYISILPTKENCGFAISGRFDFDTAILTWSGFQDKFKRFELAPETDWNLFYETHSAKNTRRWNMNFISEKGWDAKLFLINGVAKGFDIKKCFTSSPIDSINSRLSLFYGESQNGTCPRDLSTVKIVENQNSNGTTLMIKYKNIKERYLNFATYIEDTIRNVYSDFFVRNYNRTHIENNSLIISFDNDSESTNIHIVKPSEDYFYRGVPMNICRWIGCSDNRLMSDIHQIMKNETNQGNRDMCEITSSFVDNYGGERRNDILPSDTWKLTVETKKDSCDCKLFAKSNGTSSVQLRVDVCEDKLVVGRNDSFVVFMNDKPMKKLDFGYYVGSQFYYKIFRHPSKFTFFSEKCDLKFDFDGKTASIPKMSHQNSVGMCYPTKI